MGPRLCPCGEPALSNRHKYCASCRDQKTREYVTRTRAQTKKADTPERRRQRRRDERSPKQRGYGKEHDRLRRHWAPLVKTGDVSCARCGQIIDPDAPWHLDHTDDREGYLGPSHARCNLSAATGRDLTAEELERRRQLRRDNAEKAEAKTRTLYPKDHGRLRRQWARKVADGGVFCVRCLKPINPRDPWDLGHDDFDHTMYFGPEHVSCNRSAGARKTNGAYVARVTSRQWIAAK